MRNTLMNENIPNQPLVTVVIPVLNGEATIERAVKSVLRQTYSGLEVIVIDDGSTDKTLEVLKKIEDHRIIIIKHEVNKGRSAARNTGIKAANGKYIAFLDDDDEWIENKLSKQVEYLSCKEAKDWKGCLCSFSYFNGKKWIPRVNKYEGNLFKEILMMRVFLGAGSTLLIEKKVFEEIGYFNETISVNEDLDLMLRYSVKYKLGVVKDLLVRVHGHGSNFSGAEILRSKEIFFKQFGQQLNELNRKEHTYIFARQYLQVARNYAKDGDAKQTLSYLKKSLSYTFLFSEKYRILPFETYFVIPVLLLKNLVKSRKF